MANNEPICPIGQSTAPNIRANTMPNGCLPAPGGPFDPEAGIAGVMADYVVRGVLLRVGLVCYFPEV